MPSAGCAFEGRIGSSLAMKTPLVPEYDAKQRCAGVLYSVIRVARKGVKTRVSPVWAACFHLSALDSP
ncbi:MAG: hypothetical protein LZF60_370038 [Nitrospira sp.]|nr:MAG: hypothetical protein LZF60_370038 [Nitrospira sp.]